ncbi:MAG: ligand-binding sensor domain-containing protein [Clostridium sp.]
MIRKYIIRPVAFLLVVFISTLGMDNYRVNAYESLNFKNIDVEQGLTQGTVQALFQDSKGYVWIGTGDGLHRYNGNEFKEYRHNKHNENSIVDNNIIVLKEDNNNNLWVGTAEGLSKINLITDEIKTYDEKRGLTHNNICDIIITTKNEILIATAGGLFRYIEKEDRVERLFEIGLLNQEIFSICEDENGDLWIGTTGGINKISYKGNEPVIEVVDEKAYVYKMISDGEGFVWVCTLWGGLMKININSNEIERYKNTEDVKSIASNDISTIMKDKNNTIWVGTYEGLCRYNKEANDFTVFEHEQFDKQSLINNEVLSIMQDRNGIIWTGTLSGISMFNPDNVIKNYKYNFSEKNSIGEDKAVGVYEDKNLLWVGSRSKGISIINRETEEVESILASDSKFGLSSDRINTIVGDEKYVWVGTGEGLNRIDKNTREVKKYTDKQGLVVTNVSSIFVEENNVYIGTNNGLFLLDRNTDKITNITSLLVGGDVEDDYISDIYRDSKGTLWIGTFINGGLIEVNSEFKQVIVHKSNEEDNSISSNSINCITEDEEGDIWIGTKYGINKFDTETREFEIYDEDDGLINNYVYGILFDDEGDPWVSTNQGISKLDINTSTFSNLSLVDGLQHYEFNAKSSYKNEKGEMIFGGINGISIFHPNEIKVSNYKSNVIIDSLFVKGDKFINIDGYSFAHNQNSISIKYFTPDYRSPNTIKYYSILEGFDSEWRVSKGNEINYTNLPSGEYTFRIRALNHNGVIGDETSFSFKINKPFWRSGYFFILILLLIILGYFNNKARVKKLDKMVEMKTKELNNEMTKSKELLNKVIMLERNKNNYFVNLSHELRTPLNVILSSQQLIEKLAKNPEGISPAKLDNYISIMKRNSKRLLNLINNIIDTTKIESGTYNINIEKVDIVYLVEETSLALKNYIEEKGIELIIDPEIEEKIIECDGQEIERCIVNLVSNAYKFTKEGGTINITVKDLNDKVEISIKDSGIGIEKKYHEKIFDRFNQVVDFNTENKGGSGLGLTITKYIIDLHNGEIYVESEFNKGSNFIIILPVKQDKCKDKV